MIFIVLFCHHFVCWLNSKGPLLTGKGINIIYDYCLEFGLFPWKMIKFYQFFFSFFFQNLVRKFGNIYSTKKFKLHLYSDYQKDSLWKARKTLHIHFSLLNRSGSFTGTWLKVLWNGKSECFGMEEFIYLNIISNNLIMITNTLKFAQCCISYRSQSFDFHCKMQHWAEMGLDDTLQLL